MAIGWKSAGSVVVLAVVAIVPAHNEAPRIGAVIEPLFESGLFTRIVVMDDGSTDGTADAASEAGADVMQLSPNRGKGGALLAGVRATTEPVVAFFDADLVGFRASHAKMIVEPVTSGRAVMSVGLRDLGPSNKIQPAMPFITGERAVRRDVLERVPDSFWVGFRVETGINEWARRSGGPIVSAVMPGLRIVPKYGKGGGIQKGIEDAATMMRDVLIAMRDARHAP